MATVKQVLDEIAQESSTKEKQAILSRRKDTTYLKDVLYYAKSRRVKFYIRQIPEVAKHKGKMNLAVALSEIRLLSSRTVTGNAAYDHLDYILSSVDEDTADVITRIINKDLRIGMGRTLINNVYPKLIEKTPYMGAMAYSHTRVEELLEQGKCFSEIKMDGKYVNVIVRSGSAELESREGEPANVSTCKFMKELDNLPSRVYTGELTIPGIPRYISNGIISSLTDIHEKLCGGSSIEYKQAVKKFEAKHGSINEMLDRICFTTWDSITVEEYFAMKSKVPYYLRKGTLEEILSESKCEMVKPISYVMVRDTKGALDHFYKVLALGEEGTILKAFNGPWVNGKPKHQVKFKLDMDVDMEIVSFTYGTGKNSDVISSIDVVSSCGKVHASVSGMDEETMAYVTKHMRKLKGSVQEVKCSGLSKNKEGGYSLLHPRHKEFRNDKVKANSYKEILAIENAIKGL